MPPVPFPKLPTHIGTAAPPARTDLGLDIIPPSCSSFWRHPGGFPPVPFPESPANVLTVVLPVRTGLAHDTDSQGCSGLWRHPGGFLPVPFPESPVNNASTIEGLMRLFVFMG